MGEINLTCSWGDTWSTKGYRIYDKRTEKIFRSKDVIFDDIDKNAATKTIAYTDNKRNMQTKEKQLYTHLWIAKKNKVIAITMLKITTLKIQWGKTTVILKTTQHPMKQYMRPPPSPRSQWSNRAMKSAMKRLN